MRILIFYVFYTLFGGFNVINVIIVYKRCLLFTYSSYSISHFVLLLSLLLSRSPLLAMIRPVPLLLLLFVLWGVDCAGRFVFLIRISFLALLSMVRFECCACSSRFFCVFSKRSFISFCILLICFFNLITISTPAIF